MKEMAIAKNIKKITDKFTGALKTVYGDKLISVILYGSAASGEYAPRHSNINLAVILDDTSMDSLKKCAPILKKHKFLAVNPVFFTEDYIRSSTDVFPIEFIDMKENHVVLHGKDVLKDIDINIKNLRFQCEQELKSKIINIKRAYLRTTNKFLLKKILFKSLTSSVHILRNLIRLKGKEPAYAKEEVLVQIAREFNVNVASLQKILDARNNNLKLTSEETASLVSPLIEVLETISDKVDRL